MLGLGETEEEVKRTLLDLRSVDCDIVTIGQYLQPTEKHLKVENFITPEHFRFWSDFAQTLGFLQVVASPLTRSSYHAEEVQNLMKKYPRKKPLSY